MIVHDQDVCTIKVVKSGLHIDAFRHGLLKRAEALGKLNWSGHYNEYK
jgi:hypothetical protein